MAREVGFYGSLEKATLMAQTVIIWLFENGQPTNINILQTTAIILSLGYYYIRVEYPNREELSHPKRVNARTYLARMNSNRKDGSWLLEPHLIRGAEEFLRFNGYSNIEFDKKLDEGSRSFSSAISADKQIEEESKFFHLVGIVRSRIDNYDLQYFGHLESILYDIIDNYEDTQLMLVIDSLSYLPIINRDEISVAIENMMDDGLKLLFLNHRSSYAFFENFGDMYKPILVWWRYEEIYFSISKLKMNCFRGELMLKA